MLCCSRFLESRRDSESLAAAESELPPVSDVHQISQQPTKKQLVDFQRCDVMHFVRVIFFSKVGCCF